MSGDKTRSLVWSMVNWAVIQDKIKHITTLHPDQETIEEAINQIENSFTEEQLFMKEANELENLLIRSIVKSLQKKFGKEIKRNRNQQENERKMREKARQNSKVGVQILPMGANLKDLKKMGIDPDMLEDISKNLMDQFFKSKKRKSDKDDEDEDDPGDSFYM
ncbi:MAG: hypothetical protein ACTSVU_04325 [Promethearchaeota archaeon]